MSFAFAGRPCDHWHCAVHVAVAGSARTGAEGETASSHTHNDMVRIGAAGVLRRVEATSHAHVCIASRATRQWSGPFGRLCRFHHHLSAWPIGALEVHHDELNCYAP